MGATGHSFFRKSSSDTRTFGIARAVAYRGKVPPGSNLDKPSRNKVTLKIPTKDSNVLYQFKLSQDRKTMTIAAYQAEPEVKAKVSVDARRPSLDRASGEDSRRTSANLKKLNDLMSRSSVISEEQLFMIARSLTNTKGRMM